MREKGARTLRRNIKLCRLFAIVFHLRLQKIMCTTAAFYMSLRKENPRVNKKARTVTKNEDRFIFIPPIHDLSVVSCFDARMVFRLVNHNRSFRFAVDVVVVKVEDNSTRSLQKKTRLTTRPAAGCFKPFA